MNHILMKTGQITEMNTGVFCCFFFFFFFFSFWSVFTSFETYLSIVSTFYFFFSNVHVLYEKESSTVTKYTCTLSRVIPSDLCMVNAKASFTGSCSRTAMSLFSARLKTKIKTPFTLSTDTQNAT